MLNRAMRVATLALGISVLTASVSQAQPGRGGAGGFGGGRGGGGTSKSQLVNNSQVREELKLEEKQLTEIREKLEELRRKQQEEQDAVVAKVLSKSQNDRLDEIIFAQAGTRGLGSDAVAKKLGLSKDQQGKIKAAVEKNDAARRELMQSLFSRGDGGERPNRETIQKKFADLQKDAESSILGVLTADQKKKLESLKGKPFELRRQQFGGGRPGGGRPGGGGNTRPGGGTTRPEPDL